MQWDYLDGWNIETGTAAAEKPDQSITDMRGSLKVQFGYSEVSKSKLTNHEFWISTPTFIFNFSKNEPPLFQINLAQYSMIYFISRFKTHFLSRTQSRYVQPAWQVRPARCIRLTVFTKPRITKLFECFWSEKKTNKNITAKNTFFKKTTVSLKSQYFLKT